MLNYSIRRILAAIPVLLGILLLTFALARAIPGDPCRAILGEKATRETCDRFIHERGLDRPVLVQFGIYLTDVAQGDFGNSIRFNRSAVQILVERLPVTIELSLSAFILSVLVGVPLGIFSAIKRNTFIDVATMAGANLGVSIPVFWLGLMLAFFFAVVLKDTPLALPPSGRLAAGISSTPFYEFYGWTVQEGTVRFNLVEFFANFYLLNSLITGDWEVLVDAIKHLILPAVALSTIPLSIIARMTRSSLLEVLGLDYIRTARAKGLGEGPVVMKHAFRNALLPVVTIMGLQLGSLLAGAVLTETIFGLRGVGLTLFESITSRDYPIIQAFTVVIAAIYLIINLLVDISYAFLDPRIRLD
ncbi:MAG: ABC transporter permease [Anaerolineae bacterium]|nr:ABC transporter permease [Anaerolineae bacterium]